MEKYRKTYMSSEILFDTQHLSMRLLQLGIPWLFICDMHLTNMSTAVIQNALYFAHIHLPYVSHSVKQEAHRSL